MRGISPTGSLLLADYRFVWADQMDPKNIIKVSSCFSTNTKLGIGNNPNAGRYSLGGT